MNLKPVSQLTDSELYSELQLLAPLASPLSLACTLDKRYRIRKHLTLVSEAFTQLATTPNMRLLITMPPRAGKSELAGVWGTLWWLANFPDQRVIMASYAMSLAERAGKKVRGWIEAEGEKLGLQLAYGSSGARDWSLTTKGGMRSVGVGSGLTGHDGDLLCVDDPHADRAQAESLRMRDNVYEWWQSTALSRLSPDAAAVLILTRWHPDDLAGRVLKEDGLTEDGGAWTHLHIPAICEDPAKDALKRPLGGYMPHPKISEDDTTALTQYWDLKRKEAGTRDWHALYQGNPQPAEGALVTADMLRDRRMYQPTATPMKHAVAVDPSGGGRDTAGIIAGWLGDDKKLYITHDHTLLGSAGEWSRTACILAAEIGAEKIIVESNFGGDMAKLVVRTAWENLKRENLQDPKYQRLAPLIEMVHAKKGKLLRAEPVSQQIKEDNIRFASYMPELESQWASWQPTNPDSPGRIDASVHLAYGLLPIPGSEAVISIPRQSNRRNPRVISGIGHRPGSRTTY